MAVGRNRFLHLFFCVLHLCANYEHFAFIGQHIYKFILEPDINQLVALMTHKEDRILIFSSEVCKWRFIANSERHGGPWVLVG